MLEGGGGSSREVTGWCCLQQTRDKGVARRGAAWPSLARYGEAWHGEAGQGQGVARRGRAWHGQAWPGRARQGQGEPEGNIPSVVLRYVLKEQAPQRWQRSSQNWDGLMAKKNNLWARSKKKARAVWAQTGGRCWYCGIEVCRGKSYAPDLATIDHLICRERGGTDVQENLVLACLTCNSNKWTYTLEEYRARLSGIPVFTPAHIAYLEGLGIVLPTNFPCAPYEFWGEKVVRETSLETG